MGKRNSQPEQYHNVQPIDNDFVRSNPNAKKAKQQAKKAVLLRRRLAVFFVLTVIAIVGLAQFSSIQKARLAEKYDEKAKVEQQLEDVLSKQELLNLQIAKLEDDEYIAKLARKEFFLSEEGEIIFTIPKTSDEDAQQGNSEETGE